MTSQLICTIGHSNRSIEDFIALLRQNGVACLLDIRTIPKSRHNPQFGQDQLAASLAEHNIEYRYLPAWEACAAHAAIRPMQAGATCRFAATPTTCRPMSLRPMSRQ